MFPFNYCIGLGPPLKSIFFTQERRFKAYVFDLDDSTGAWELIQLLNLIDPRLEGCIDPREWLWVCIKWYYSLNFSLCEEELGTMPQRRCEEKLVPNLAMEEDMRKPRARLDSMETT
jgi:hypothetical protein